MFACASGGLALLQKDDAAVGAVKMNIRLTDGPANYEAVLIDVQ
ncbi:hypothetical protein [Pedobacter panaciterrae]|nr:hypothetical protein [uncultured Pedobacter sp.]